MKCGTAIAIDHSIPECLIGAERYWWSRLMHSLGNKPLAGLEYELAIHYCQLQALRDQCLADIQQRGITYKAKNGCLAKNPSVVLVQTIGDRIRRLGKDLSLPDADSPYPGYSADELSDAARFEGLIL